MVNKIIFSGSLMATVIVMVILCFTTPTEIGPIGVFLFFGLVYVVMFGISVLIVRVFRSIKQKNAELTGKSYAEAAVLAFWPIIMLLMIAMGTNNLIMTGLSATFTVGVGMLLINKFI